MFLTQVRLHGSITPDGDFRNVSITGLGVLGWDCLSDEGGMAEVFDMIN